MTDVGHLAGKALGFGAAAFPVISNSFQSVELDAGQPVDSGDRVFFPAFKFGYLVPQAFDLLIVGRNICRLGFQSVNFRLLLSHNATQLRHLIFRCLQLVFNLLGQFVFVGT